MRGFVFGVAVAWVVEAFLLWLLVDFSALRYPVDDAIAIVAVGIVCGLMAGGAGYVVEKA